LLGSIFGYIEDETLLLCSSPDELVLVLLLPLGGTETLCGTKCSSPQKKFTRIDCNFPKTSRGISTSQTMPQSRSYWAVHY